MCNVSNECKHNNVSIYLSNSIWLYFVPTIAECMVDHNQVIYLFIIHDIIVMVFSWLNGCLENGLRWFSFTHISFSNPLFRMCVHACMCMYLLAVRRREYILNSLSSGDTAN